MKIINKLLIIGAGGFGREILWLIERINEVNKKWDICGFLDDDERVHGNIINDYKVLGGINYLESITEKVYVIVAIGNANTKKAIIDRIQSYKNVCFATLIDPSVLMSKFVTVGEGSIICAGSILTTNISIGRFVTINLDCTLGHDDVISDYVTLYPSVNVSGCVKIGECSEIGTGTQIIQGKELCDNVITGAGTIVVKDVIRSGTYVGCPAKQIS